MSELKQLTLLELRSLYGINKYRYTKDSKEKRRFGTLFSAWIILGAMICVYVYTFVCGLTQVGLGEIAPSYLVMISSVLILFFGIFKAGGMMFSQKGYDILASLPIHARSVVIARFISMYVSDLILALAVMIPGTVACGMNMQCGVPFYVFAAVSALLVPMIPLVISLFVGTVVTALTARLKHKNLIQTALTVLFLVAVLMLSFTAGNSAEGIDMEQFASVAAMINGIIGNIYLPAVWAGNAMMQADILGLVLYFSVSVGAFALTVWLVSRCFHAVSRLLGVTYAKHNYKMEALRTGGVLSALTKREMKRYFSSGIYVTNTIIGPIMAVIMSASILISGIDTVASAFPINIDVKGLVPFALAAVMCMMSTTSVSVSMEGRQFWIVKTLPVPTKSLIDSKILFSLLLALPFYLLSEILLIIALSPSPIELLWLILIPLTAYAFTAVFGIKINLLLHSFDWTREETVVKQSASAMIGGFGGTLTVLLLGAAVILAPSGLSNIIKLCGIAALICASALMYLSSCKVKLERL